MPYVMRLPDLIYTLVTYIGTYIHTYIHNICVTSGQCILHMYVHTYMYVHVTRLDMWDCCTHTPSCLKTFVNSSAVPILLSKLEGGPVRMSSPSAPFLPLPFYSPGSGVFSSGAMSSPPQSLQS